MSTLIIGSLFWRQMKISRGATLLPLCAVTGLRVHPGMVLLYNLTPVKSELKWVTHGN